MDKYMRKAHQLELWPDKNPEYVLAIFLTVTELFVAIDRLVLKEIPMLANYPPPFLMAVLEKMLLRRTASLHRLSCAYQYLFACHSQSHPGWSAISNDFSEDSFQVCYYDQSPDLQQLKAHVEEDVMNNVSERSCFRHGSAGLTRTPQYLSLPAQ